MTYYATGTASVTNGESTITFASAGLGSAEFPTIKPGDLFSDPAQPEIPPQRIASIDYDAAEADLWAPWPGTTMAAAPYEIRLIDDTIRSSAQTRRYLELLGELDALGIQPNAFGEFADRDEYDDAAKGFIFLSLDGDGDENTAWTLYAKLSGDSADWDAGQSVEGAQGPQGERGWSPIHGIVADGARRVQVLLGYVGGEGEAPTDHVGEYVAADGYTETIGEAVDIRGSAGADGIDGESFNWAGAYDNGTAYDEDDVVQHNGSSWIALQATTGNVPPTLPTTANDYWELVAAKGADGAGAGDVTAAASIADGALVVGDGGGKGIKAHASGAPGTAAFSDTGDFAAAAAAVPSGGTTGQVLAKKSSTDHDTEWVEQSGGREVLTGNRTYYVRTDGSDSNDGLSDSSGGAFLTIAKAIATIYTVLDCAGRAVTIQLGDGTHGQAAFDGRPLNCGQLRLRGNVSSPSNVIIETASANAVQILGGADVYLDGFEVRTTTAGAGLYVRRGGVARLGITAPVNFGECAGDQIDCFEMGQVYIGGSYTISGSAASHWHCHGQSRIVIGAAITITLTDSPHFANYFAGVNGAVVSAALATFSGAGTGQKFLVHRNGSISRGTNNISDLPGDVRGVARTGGYYDDYTGDRWLKIAQQTVESAEYTGTTGTAVLASATLRAGWMGPNGRVRIKSWWRCTSNANAKTAQIRFGGTSIMTVPLNTFATFVDVREVFNQNAPDAQIGGSVVNGSTAGLGASTQPQVTATEDTDSDVTIAFRAALTDAGDSFWLTGYLIEMLGSD